MPRVYNVTFEGVAIAAAQDLFQIIGATGKQLRIRKAWIGGTDTSLPTAQMLQTRARFLPATVTNGSGGSSPTPQPLDPGDAAASFTAKANNTTKATTSGTASVLYENGVHLYAGDTWQVPKDTGEQSCIGPSESFVYEMLSAPTGTVHMSGGVTVEETGG